MEASQAKKDAAAPFGPRAAAWAAPPWQAPLPPLPARTFVADEAIALSRGGEVRPRAATQTGTAALELASRLPLPA
jgi:hypothetical protein